MEALKKQNLRRIIAEMRHREMVRESVWRDRFVASLDVCPFCGEEPDIMRKLSPPMGDTETRREVWIVGCQTCEVFQGAYEIEKAVRLWNHRIYFGDPDTEPWEVQNIKLPHSVEPVAMRMCPFCGCAPHILEIEKYRNNHGVMEPVLGWMIACRDCEVSMSSVSYQAVERAWNNRSGPRHDWTAGRLHLDEDFQWCWPDVGP